MTDYLTPMVVRFGESERTGQNAVVIISRTLLFSPTMFLTRNCGGESRSLISGFIVFDANARIR